MRFHWLAIAAAATATTATAAPAGKSGPPKPAVWLGVFLPNVKLPCKAGCGALAPTPRGGFVRVLTPSDGSKPPTGQVTIVHPLTKAVVSGVVLNGIVPVAAFAHDENRDNDDSVLVLPGDVKPAIVPVTSGDVLPIRTALLAQAEELAKVRKSLDHLEIALVDIDGDGKPDLAATFGCNNWADGSCQSRGQFFLAKRGTRWVVIE
jgi:hypothetical protein